MNTPDLLLEKDPTQHPAVKQDIWKSLISNLAPTVKSILLFFCMLFILRFWFLLFHEGGHALGYLIVGYVPKVMHAHPFTFGGFVITRPSYEDRVLPNAAGPVMAVLVSLLIFILLWKHRSVAILPLVMIFPWAAIDTGLSVAQIAQIGDYANIIHLTGLPETAIIIPCLVTLVIGIFFFLSLLPLLGLNPKDWHVLLVLPVATILWSGVSILVAQLVVPGSPIDVIYHEGRLVIWSAEVDWQGFLSHQVGLAVIYLTLFRLIYSRLPSWLKSETVKISWNDLRIPALSAAACIFVGWVLIH